MERSGQQRASASFDAGLELLAASVPQVVWIAAPDGWSEYFGRHAGFGTELEAKANRGWKWLELLHPDDADRTARAWRDAIAAQAPLAIEHRLRCGDGAYRFHACEALPVQSSDGGIVRWIGTLIDREDHRELEQTLQAARRFTGESLALLETLQSTAPVGFGFIDCDWRVVRINDTLAATTGIPGEQQVGRPIAEVIPELWPELEPAYSQMIETAEPVVNRETEGAVPGDPGHVHTWLTSFYPVRLGSEVIGTGIVMIDVSERKAMERELDHLSEHDPLTGLYNRRRLFGELERVLRYAERYGHRGALLRLDIDNFKWTNNSYGHAAGDHLLKAVAQLLRDRLRDTDILARVGGDEFAVVLPQTTREQALQVALELRALLCERPNAPPVNVSVGITLFGVAEKLSADDVLTAANIAMDHAKQAGGDQATVYDRPAGELLSKVRQLRDALAEKRFTLHAQPIIDLRTGQVAQQELLLRMLSGTGAIIPPSEFLPIAERFSLVTEIDRWVISQALALAHREPVSVNLSARSVGDPRILTAVRDAIGAGLDPANLTFEITETAVMSNFETALAFVSALTALGCDLALDDFGTGFGSFTYLKHLPARYLKIDMEFVRDINEDPTDKEIVRSIVGIAHTLGKHTIAEGVESASVHKTLRQLGVDYAQGYHLGRPRPLPPPSVRNTRAA